MSTKTLHTIDDGIVRDALTAIGCFADGKVPKAITGGIAVQAYLPREFYRSTCDVDVVTFTPSTYSDFRGCAKPVYDCAKKLGYYVRRRRDKEVYCLDMTAPDGEAFEIQFVRLKSRFEKDDDVLKREHDNAQNISVNGLTFIALRPEDIARGKAARIAAFDGCDRRVGIRYDSDIKRYFHNVQRIRERLARNSGNANIMEVLNARLNSDAFDIYALIECEHFDVKYFWDGILMGSKFTADERLRQVMKRVHPKLAEVDAY